MSHPRRFRRPASSSLQSRAAAPGGPVTDHGYLVLDTLRVRAILHAEERQAAPFEGYRVLPRETAAERVRRERAEREGR